MKKQVILLIIALVAVLLQWSCTPEPERRPAPKPNVPTVPKDTTKPKDTVKVDPFDRLPPVDSAGNIALPDCDFYATDRLTPYGVWFFYDAKWLSVETGKDVTWMSGLEPPSDTMLITRDTLIYYDYARYKVRSNLEFARRIYIKNDSLFLYYENVKEFSASDFIQQSNKDSLTLISNPYSIGPRDGDKVLAKAHLYYVRCR